jgi:hypothetical protein
MPGDDLVPDPDVVLTRGITIPAPPGDVFPWLVQLGQGRGGFYSYDWLEGLAGLDIRSADRILPQFQQLAPGDRVPVAPEPPFYGFVVASILAPSHLVLRMRIHPLTGLAIPQEAPDAGWSLDGTWSFALSPVTETSTRLVSRTRARLRLPLGLRHPYRLALELAEFVMGRRMLLGIRDRAQRLAASPPSPSPRRTRRSADRLERRGEVP